ncbi:hypothetical protein F8O06_05055 [Pseudoclavibacter sp. CFCC 14310]|uniref:hypothetical protein n=1 Tax=Pseudoclavibacter sp. CFCC 14310 TaxID=2615180 RepID=UPI0013010627|nr:hypothetical protein [Pseudoclavibacter sp. CFCC 14310]KAB1645407.1 hypothetical protein F8O06_07390 [Pseudoclavibacter sp. CFCC 14310]KAB1646134.1 hypothetical protein F8O06_05055 [Pseudoclavibacter sp. CFCC 14310]
MIAQVYDRADAEEIVAALNAKTALEQTDAANARADGLTAVIEQVRAEVEELRRQGYPVGALVRILATAPSAALAHLKAEVLRWYAEKLMAQKGITLADALILRHMNEAADQFEREAGCEAS